MEQLISQILSEASGAGSYGIILGVLLLCGLGLPIPEDFVLITGGYLVHAGAANLGVMIGITYFGILGGDSLAFWLGRHFGHRLERSWPFRLFITPPKRRRVERLFGKYGQKIVMAARFMPGVRAVTFFLAGSAHMSYPRFLFFDGVAALVSAPLFVLLGWHFGANIEWLAREVRKGQWIVVGAIAAAVAAWLLYRRAMAKRRARQDAALLEALSANDTPNKD